MALVVFGEKIDFTSITLPEEGGYVVGYDINTDLLSQMDYLGNVTIIGTLGGGAPLSTTLGLGNVTGTHSIVLDSSITKGTNKILLDDGRVSITTANGDYTESYLYMNSTDTILGNGSSKSFRIESTGITTKWSDTDRQTINTNSYELVLNNLNTLQFGKLSSGAGSKLSALISTDNSTIGNGLVNTVVIGGQNISALESNSVYVPYLLIQDGKVIKGTKGSGQIQFTETGDVISSNSNSVIGVISSTSSITFTQNGIFVKDSATASSSPDIDSGITYVSTRNSSATASIKNSVVIGGQDLIATADDTIYLGNNVNINNAFTLPTTDGSIGQVLKTDGLGNVTWGGVAATLNLVSLDYTAFVSLGGVFEVDTTYVITNADTSLYGGTEIYLTTNSNGVLNDEGIGKFYNPNYTSAAGFGIFVTSSTYAINSTTIWGGYVWENTTGTHSSPTDLFTLNGIVENWIKITFDEIYYTISYDKIKYDWQNDLIVYRNEKNTNIVSTSKSNIDTFLDINPLYNPIKAFQWGNVYDYLSGKGIGGQNIINSYNENINFRGMVQNNITMVNLSAQYNLIISTSQLQENLTFDNYQYDRQSILLNTSENGLFFQGDLPNTTPSKLMGKINNQQVEIDLTTVVIGGSGYGVTNSIPKWTNPSTLGNSNISDNGSVVNITGNFQVSSGGTTSLVVGNGNVYNRGKGGILTNTVFGASALSVNTTGYNNTVFGASALSVNTTGYNNVAIGVYSLLSNTIGRQNIGIGSGALTSNILGNSNLAIGDYVLYNATSSSGNIAIGASSMYSNTTGYNNTSIGLQSMLFNETGYENVSVGYYTLYSNMYGYQNTAIGTEALYSNTNGVINTGVGYRALYSNTTGTDNTAIGVEALFSNSIGSGNVAIGAGSLANGISTDSNVSIGASCLISTTTGDYNVGIGALTLYSNTTGYQNTVIGFNSFGSNTIGYNNTAIGHQAGPGYFGATNSKNSIYIGHQSGNSSHGYDNEIIIGTTMSYGTNSVVLGNNNITKTILSGSILVGTTTTSSSAILKIDSLGQGVLVPRMTTSQINLIALPIEDGLIVYNTDLNLMCYYNGNTATWMKITGVVAM